MTLSGRSVASPISVIDSDDVFDASIAWPGVTASSSPKTACLISMRSGTASITKSTSPKPSYSVVPWMRSSTPATCVPAASSFSLPRSTSLPTWLCVTFRASASPASTRSSSTSLSTTGMPADAMVWAIWPPIVPAPTTAALNTNMIRTALLRKGKARQASPSQAGIAVGPHLGGEPAQRPLERLALRAADEQEIERAERAALLRELVVELERDRHAPAAGRERHPLRAADLLVLDLERLADARLVAEDALEDPPAPAGGGVPDDAGALVRPLAVDAGDVLAAVDERRPAARVVPERLGLARLAGDVDARADPTHPRQTRSSRWMRSMPAATASRRGASSTASREGSRSPSGGRREKGRGRRSGCSPSPRTSPRCSSDRSSGYIVFGLTAMRPPVSSVTRSMSWLPYDGSRERKCSTSSGSSPGGRGGGGRRGRGRGRGGPCPPRPRPPAARRAVSSGAASATARSVGRFGI